jgi:hypothetical protein
MNPVKDSFDTFRAWTLATQWARRPAPTSGKAPRASAQQAASVSPASTFLDNSEDHELRAPPRNTNPRYRFSESMVSKLGTVQYMFRQRVIPNRYFQ